MQVFYCMQVLHASLLLQLSVQLQYFHARLAGVTAEIIGVRARGARGAAAPPLTRAIQYFSGKS